MIISAALAFFGALLQTPASSANLWTEIGKVDIANQSVTVKVPTQGETPASKVIDVGGSKIGFDSAGNIVGKWSGSNPWDDVAKTWPEAGKRSAASGAPWKVKVLIVTRLDQLERLPQGPLRLVRAGIESDEIRQIMEGLARMKAAIEATTDGALNVRFAVEFDRDLNFMESDTAGLTSAMKSRLRLLVGSGEFVAEDKKDRGPFQQAIVVFPGWGKPIFGKEMNVPALSLPFFGVSASHGELGQTRDYLEAWCEAVVAGAERQGFRYFSGALFRSTLPARLGFTAETWKAIADPTPPNNAKFLSRFDARSRATAKPWSDVAVDPFALLPVVDKAPEGKVIVPLDAAATYASMISAVEPAKATAAISGQVPSVAFEPIAGVPAIALAQVPIDGMRVWITGGDDRAWTVQTSGLTLEAVMDSDGSAMPLSNGTVPAAGDSRIGTVKLNRGGQSGVRPILLPGSANLKLAGLSIRPDFAGKRYEIVTNGTFPSDARLVLKDADPQITVAPDRPSIGVPASATSVKVVNFKLRSSTGETLWIALTLPPMADTGIELKALLDPINKQSILVTRNPETTKLACVDSAYGGARAEYGERSVPVRWEFAEDADLVCSVVVLGGGWALRLDEKPPVRVGNPRLDDGLVGGSVTPDNSGSVTFSTNLARQLSSCIIQSDPIVADFDPAGGGAIEIKSLAIRPHTNRTDAVVPKPMAGKARLDSTDPLERAWALSAVPSDPDSGTKKRLLDLLQKEVTVEGRIALLDAYRKVKDLAAEPFLAGLTDNLTTGVAYLAGQAIALQGTPSALASARRIATGSPFIAARLGAVQALSLRKDPKYAGAFGELLVDPSISVRSAAAAALAKTGDATASLVALAFLPDPNPVVRVAVIENADPAVEEVGKRLQYLAVNDPADAIRAEAYGALLRTSNPALMREGFRGLKDDSRFVRAAVALTLGTLSDPEAVRWLALAAVDPATEVRVAAWEALSKTKTVWAITALEQALNEQHPLVQRAIVQAATERKLALPAAAIARLRDSADPEVARAASKMAGSRP